MALRFRIERTEAPRSSTRRRGWTVAAATVVVGVLITGVSYAYWSATGTGSASVVALTASPVVVTNTPVTDLYPGKTDDVTVTLKNNNPYNVSVALTTLTLTSVTGGTGCPAINVSLKPGPYTPASIAVNAGQTVTATMVGLVTLSINAPDGCQGSTVNLSLTFTGSQV